MRGSIVPTVSQDKKGVRREVESEGIRRQICFLQKDTAKDLHFLRCIGRLKETAKWV